MYNFLKLKVNFKTVLVLICYSLVLFPADRSQRTCLQTVDSFNAATLKRFNIESKHLFLSLCDRQFSQHSKHECESTSESLAVIFRKSLCSLFIFNGGFFGFISSVLWHPVICLLNSQYYKTMACCLTVFSFAQNPNKPTEK
jgi:hypothetical protein